jgi:hypothetical protein
MTLLSKEELIKAKQELEKLPKALLMRANYRLVQKDLRISTGAERNMNFPLMRGILGCRH